MASTNPYTSFTITQPFLGAPLQFQPALGSKELEELIDAFVTGSARKQDKFSEITLDFYNNATVDLNTGALTRTYNVFPSPWTSNAFEQSPTQSQSSGFSPIYTPSPGSSANTFGDSAYGSISMTPPTRNRGVRVTKKARKDTPKAAEARLPGFSIMTKDGIDVTNSAGRGTKTKEQREHAHLMRIMKACDACKKKKIRCDPSHRRSHNDMSRTSTSTTQTSSSGRLDPSPAASTPPLSRATTHASQSSLPSFSPSNPIDDFVLFPEDSSSWNADISFPELETQDLGQFNFDINDIDLNDYPSMNADHSFEFSFDRQTSDFHPNTQFGYLPNLNDQYGLDQWAEPQGFIPVAHTRPHPSGLSNDSGQLDASWQSGWLQADALISPRTTTFADNYWPDGLVDHPQMSQNAAVNNSPLLTDTPDWSLFESSIVSNSSSPVDETADNGFSQASEPRRSRKRRAADEQESNRSSGETFEQLDQDNVIRNTGDIGSLDPFDLLQAEAFRGPDGAGVSPANSSLEHSPFSAGSTKVSRGISRLQNSAQLVSKSLRSIRRAPAEYVALGTELQQLEGTLARLQSSQHDETILSESAVTLIQSLATRLQGLSSRGKQSVKSSQPIHRRHNKLENLRPDQARELQVIARRLVRSLCAIINAVEAQNTGTTSPTDNRPMLTSGRNLQLQISSSESHDHERQSQALSSGAQSGDNTSCQSSTSSPAHSGLEASEAVLQPANGDMESLDIRLKLDGVCSTTRNERDSVAAETLAMRNAPRYSMLLKITPSDLPPHGVEGSRPSERSDQTELELIARMDSHTNRGLPLMSMSTPNEADDKISSSGQTVPRAGIRSQEETGGLANVQQVRANMAIPSPLADHANWHVDDAQSTSPRSASLAVLQYASTQEVALSQGGVESSLHSTASYQTSSTVQQAALSNAFDTQYSFVAALSALGSLALASNIFSSSGLNISTHLSYLLPLLALSLLIPGQHHPSTALLAGTFLLATSFILSGVQTLRINCTEWIGNEPFFAVAKLLLVAALVASDLLSELNIRLIVVMAMNYLCGTRDACSVCDGIRVPRRESSAEREGSFASWLGMMDVLSPVVAV